MDPHSPDDPFLVKSDGVSRRDALRLGAGGLAVALLAHGIETTRAQDGTPPVSGGLPAGASLTSLSAFPVRDLPTKPFTIRASQLTLEPGTVIPNSASPYPSAAYAEDGDFVCPPAGERWIYDPAGKVIASGTGLLTFPKGTWCYTPPDALDGIRNDGSKPASILLLELVPTT